MITNRASTDIAILLVGTSIFVIFNCLLSRSLILSTVATQSSYHQLSAAYPEESLRNHTDDPIIIDLGPQPCRAVVHMGPHKTGTTTIQMQSDRYSSLLKSDGYEMPWDAMNKTIDEGHRNVFYNQKNFASCFFKRGHRERRRHKCNDDLVSSGLEIAKRRRNLLVSAEKFAKMESDGLERLSEYLSHWDEVVIVIYYRRFHQWLASDINQKRKFRKLLDKSPIMWEFSMAQNIQLLLGDPLVDDRYTTGLSRRLRENFDNVVVTNYHDKSPDESFYCHALPGATRTCKDMLAKNKEKSVHKNKKTTLDYGDLAYGAIKAGLVKIESNEGMKKVTRAVKNYQENTLNLTSDDFQRKCPPVDVLDMVWQKSLSSEMELFPEHVNGSSTTMADLRSDFEKSAKTTLCNVNVQETLEDVDWQNFFRSYDGR